MDECTAAHEKLDFLQAGRVAYDFFWNQFADWYVEASKTRLYGQDPDRAATSRQVMPAIAGIEDSGFKARIGVIRGPWEDLSGLQDGLKG